MKKDDFKQGMAHEYALKEGTLRSEMPLVTSPDVLDKIDSHQATLSGRPDWDGLVTREEGIAWAKSHPGALEKRTADNMLYIDASQLDFGNISTSQFQLLNESTPINLFNVGNSFESLYNSRLFNTVYALGRVNMTLLNRDTKSVKIVNDYNLDFST